MVYYCWVWGLLIFYNYMVMLHCPCLRVLNKVLCTGHLHSLVVVISSSSLFCLCRYFLYFFITGDVGSSSNITSFNASVICSVGLCWKDSFDSWHQPSQWRWWWYSLVSWFSSHQRCRYLCHRFLLCI